MKVLKRCWAVIDLDAITHNVKELKKMIPNDCKFLAVVKAEGYGHGMIPAAKACLEGGADWFGVATIEEAIELRNADIKQPILVLGITPVEWAAELIKYNLTQTVGDVSYAIQLNESAQKEAHCIDIHIKVDTGMGRVGINTISRPMEETIENIKNVCNLPYLNASGIMSHLSSARDGDNVSVSFTKKQISSFRIICDELKKEGISLPIRHLLNSGGTINYTDDAFDMVRVGYMLFANVKKFASGVQPNIKPAMEIHTSIGMVKELPEGSKISYSRLYTAERPTKVAVVGLGYCDGYNSNLTNKGQVIVRGQRVPVIGKVCMDQMMIDVTDIKNIKIGDAVTIVGMDGNDFISMEDVRLQSGMIMNDPVSASLTNRMTRLYRKGGKIIGYLQTTQKMVLDSKLSFDGNELL